MIKKSQVMNLSLDRRLREAQAASLKALLFKEKFYHVILKYQW